MGSITESQEPRRFFATADKQEFDPENWTSQDPLPPRCPPTNVQVLIVGAGFAGLMAALECWRKGHDVVGIVDRNQGPNYSGDLIIIQPSALEIMKHWPQMRRELEDKVTVGTYYYRHNGELVDGPAQPNYNAPEYVAEREARLGGFPYVGAVQIRKKFYRMLLRQVARLGFRVDYGQRVESYFEDESAGFAGVRMTDASIRKAHVVVAADGFRSASELLIADDEYPPTQSSGMSVYRTAFPAKLAFADEGVRQRWGGKHTYEFWMGSSMHIGLYLSPELAAFGITPRDHQRSAAAGTPLAPVPVSSLRTSLVHRVIEESFSSAAGKVIVQSDMMQADFLAAAWGHQMNGAGVVTSSIHADIAWTLGKYLLDLLKPNSKKSIVDMEISNLVVREGLVAQKNRSVPQFIQVSISTANIDSGVAYLEWHNVTNDGVSLADQEPIVTAQIRYGTAGDYLFSWVPTLHLVQGRIEALSRLADDGIANRLSNNMAYLLFADRYRGMQSVVLQGLEAFADVRTKPDDEGGVWTVPPFFIDSVCHLAGFVLNVSDAIDTKNFCVTPGWGSLRMARSLVAGGRYRSYVKMIPIAEDPTVYLGDVYVLEGDAIIGVMQAMKFRRYPRVLLNRFFTPAEIKNPASGAMPCANGAGSLYN